MKEYRVINLDSEDFESKDTWSKGKRDKYTCPECLYLGETCDLCLNKGVDDEWL